MIYLETTHRARMARGERGKRMASLLELEKGDPNELEGRVIIYGQVTPLDEHGEPLAQEFDGEPLALFCTTRPSDFAEKFGAPPGGLEELARKQAEAAKQAGAADVLPMYGAAINLEETDLTITPDDVINVGAYTDRRRCQSAIQFAAHVYLLRYSEQLHRRSGVKGQNGVESPGAEEAASSAAEAGAGAGEPGRPLTYDDVPRDQMSEYLQSKFIGPIMHAIEDGNRAEALRVAHDFVRFSGPRAPLTDDAYALAAAVREIRDGDDPTLLHRYFEKLLAVSDERFEDAARLRDEIRAIKARSPRTPDS